MTHRNVTSACAGPADGMTNGANIQAVRANDHCAAIDTAI
jgi:hypothetical protein